MSQEARVVRYHGDALDVIPTLADESVDAVVTDPPYELGFMGRAWDASGIAYNVDLWKQCLRVLKPGGHLLAFGGTRTSHRLAVAVEDAGFEIRDSIVWIYGSGFPKSLDVSKAIDKATRGGLVREKLLHFAEVRGIDGRWLEERGVASAASFLDWTTGGHVPSDRNWQIVKTALEVTPDEESEFERKVLRTRSRGSTGRMAQGDGGYAFGEDFADTAPATDDAKRWAGWGTALKPAHEPIVVARKPLVGTVAVNVLAHGTGALNIDACRVGDGGQLKWASPRGMGSPDSFADDAWTQAQGRPYAEATASTVGRWPANVVLDEDAAVELDEQSGVLRARGNVAPTAGGGGMYGHSVTTVDHGAGDTGGASRFFPVFRYQAKAPTRERVKIDGVAHPTVKPLELMRWLVRLVTQPDGVVLEPFAGSGTTVEACILEGMRCLAIEREESYLPLIAQRIERAGLVAW